MMRKPFRMIYTFFLLLPLAVSGVAYSEDTPPPVDPDRTGPDIEAEEQSERFSNLVDDWGAYGSLRLNLGADSNTTDLRDGGSRIGLKVDKHLQNDARLAIHIEAGMDLVEGAGGNIVSTPDANEPVGTGDNFLFTRLGYITYEKNNTSISAGKQWSVYSDVSTWTELFAIWGGEASGTYNAGTDGGGSGTGRADKSVIWRQKFDTGTQLGVQLQFDPEAPVIDVPNFDKTYSFSVIQDLPGGFAVGGGYSRAEYNAITPAMMMIGITGDDMAKVLTVSWDSGPWYAALNVSETENHDTAGGSNMFADMDGAEGYVEYLYTPRWKLATGFNHQEPSNSNQGGLYELNYAVISVSHAFRNEDFSDMVYAELRLDNSKSFNGTGLDSVIGTGIYFSF